MIAVDTSALMAIIFGESDAEIFSEKIYSESAMIGAPLVIESYQVAFGKLNYTGISLVDAAIKELGIQIFPFSEEELLAAQKAVSLYGKGRGHPARLNLGDCFSYALARTFDIPLLFKGNDFTHTDIKPALPQAAP